MNDSVWSVYLKAQELKGDDGHPAIPISLIAEQLIMSPQVAEECAIMLQMLNLVQFDDT